MGLASHNRDSLGLTDILFTFLLLHLFDSEASRRVLAGLVQEPESITFEICPVISVRAKGQRRAGVFEKAKSVK